MEIEIQSLKILILAKTFNRNRGSKVENIDFSRDIHSKSTFESANVDFS